MEMSTEIRCKVLVDAASKRSIRRDYLISAEALEKFLPHPALARFSLTLLAPTPRAPPICRNESPFCMSFDAASKRSLDIAAGRSPLRPRVRLRNRLTSKSVRIGADFPRWLREQRTDTALDPGGVYLAPGDPASLLMASEPVAFTPDSALMGPCCPHSLVRPIPI
jgi:hypothetical protein